MRYGSLLVIVLLVLPVHVFSSVWTIRVDGTGDAPDLSSVMDSIAAGDSILIDSGHYYFTGFLQTPFELEDISIIGIMGAENTVLDFSGLDFGIFVQSQRTLIKGLTFQNAARYCVNLSWCAESTVESCIIRYNGHGIALDMAGVSVIDNNLIYANDIGISLTDWSGSITITGNTIAYHRGEDSQAISFEPSSGGHVVEKNIIYDNTTISDWGPASVTFECNVLFDNDDQTVPTVTCVDCIYLHPQFCGADPLASGNFYLQADSPCCPENNPTCGLIGAFGVRCDEVGNEASSWGRIKSSRGE